MSENSDRVFDTRPGRRKAAPSPTPAPEPIIEEVTEQEVTEQAPEEPEIVNEAPEPAKHTKAKAYRHGN